MGTVVTSINEETEGFSYLVIKRQHWDSNPGPSDLQSCWTPAFCFLLSDEGTFVVMKNQALNLTSHMHEPTGTHRGQKSEGSRAPDRQGPEGFEGFQRHDFRDSGGTLPRAGNIPAGFFTASLPPFTQHEKSLF